MLLFCFVNTRQYSYDHLFIYSFRMEVMGHDVTFSFQFGHLRDTVTVPASSLNLKSFKDMACNFLNSKVSS